MASRTDIDKKEKIFQTNLKDLLILINILPFLLLLTFQFPIKMKPTMVDPKQEESIKLEAVFEGTPAPTPSLSIFPDPDQAKKDELLSFIEGARKLILSTSVDSITKLWNKYPTHVFTLQQAADFWFPAGKYPELERTYLLIPKKMEKLERLSKIGNRFSKVFFHFL